jgi:AcrR family transcriptional regulator
MAVEPQLLPTKGEQTRRLILDAAIARFGREGYRATSVADIAREASVGGTLPYAYFPSKEALFFAAVDEDAAGVIHDGLSTALTETGAPRWWQTLLLTLVAALDRHPLARRLLAGLEPDVTGRVLEMPALAELRKACARQLVTEQRDGSVRSDIDVVPMANGIVAIMLSLLMSAVQVGSDSAALFGDDIAAVFEAAIRPHPPPGPSLRGPSINSG